MLPRLPSARGQIPFGQLNSSAFLHPWVNLFRRGTARGFVRRGSSHRSLSLGLCQNVNRQQNANLPAGTNSGARDNFRPRHLLPPSTLPTVCNVQVRLNATIQSDDTCALIMPLARQVAHHDKLTAETVFCNSRDDAAVCFQLVCYRTATVQSAHEFVQGKHKRIAPHFRCGLFFATIGIVQRAFSGAFAASSSLR